MNTVYVISINQAWEASQVLLAFIIIGLIFLITNKFYHNEKIVFLGWMFFIFSSLMLTFYIGSYVYYLSLYHTQQYEVLKGTIVVKRQQPKNRGYPKELIMLEGKPFDFSYYDSSPGYNQTINNGGFLTEGAYVKIFFAKNKILRVDVDMKGD